jgi:hypothetical protein
MYSENVIRYMPGRHTNLSFFPYRKLFQLKLIHNPKLGKAQKQGLFTDLGKVNLRFFVCA